MERYLECIASHNQAANIYKKLNNTDAYYIETKNIVGAYLKLWEKTPNTISQNEVSLCSQYVYEMIEYYKWDAVFYSDVKRQKEQLDRFVQGYHS